MARAFAAFRTRRVAVPRGLAVAAGALAVATLSLLWASIPQFDPLGWLLWGRGLFGPPHFTTESYPSWKPLPALFTVPLALTGPAAPALWLVIARTAVLALAVGVFRVARRWGGTWGGAFAVLGLLFVPRLVETAGWGHVEPLVAALVVGAAERHLSTRPRQALALLGLASLGRPEAWALLVPYAAWLVRRVPGSRRAVALVVMLVPVLWFGGDLLGSGDAFHGSTLAQEASGPAGPDVGALVSAVLGYAVDTVSPIWLVAAIVAVVLARRDRRRLVVLAAAVVAWVAATIFEAAQGLHVEARFLITAGALLCALAGAGLGLVLERVGTQRRRVALGIAVLAVVLSVVVERPGVARQIAHVGDYERDAEGLDRAVAAARQRQLLEHCHVTASHPYQARLAWDLDRSTDRVSTPRPVGLAFERRRVLDGRLLRFLRAEGDRVTVSALPLGHEGLWTLLRLDAEPVGTGDLRCRTSLRQWAERPSAERR